MLSPLTYLVVSCGFTSRDTCRPTLSNAVTGTETPHSPLSVPGALRDWRHCVRLAYWAFGRGKSDEHRQPARARATSSLRRLPRSLVMAMIGHL